MAKQDWAGVDGTRGMRRSSVVSLKKGSSMGPRGDLSFEVIGASEAG
jgi:hypothetical protein